MPIKKVKTVSAYKSAYFRRTDFKNFSVATAVIFHYNDVSVISNQWLLQLFYIVTGAY